MDEEAMFPRKIDTNSNEEHISFYGNDWPDISTCTGLVFIASGWLGLRYEGALMVTLIGNQTAQTIMYANLWLEESDCYQSYRIPFDRFANHRDESKHFEFETCAENKTHCPNEDKDYILKDVHVLDLGFYGNGEAEFGIKSIKAYGCDYDFDYDFDDDDEMTPEIALGLVVVILAACAACGAKCDRVVCLSMAGFYGAKWLGNRRANQETPVKEYELVDTLA